MPIALNRLIKRSFLLLAACCVAESAAAQTDADRYQLEEAASACRNRSFSSFFQAFVRSQAVRDRYTAAELVVGENARSWSVPRAGYLGFPLAFSDYTYVWKPSEAAGPNRQQYLRVKFVNLAQGEHRVDWVRVRYAGNGNDRDSTARVFGTIGAPGSLLFKPLGECWELVSDRTGSPRSPSR